MREADLRKPETIPPDMIAKLRDIAAQRRSLDDEEERILAELAGAAPGAQAPAGGNFEPDAPSRPHMRASESPDIALTVPNVGHEAPAAPEERVIDLSNLMTIPKAAEAWQCHPRTMRRVADHHGAIVKIGGKVYVDRKTFAQSINVQNCSKFSISKKGKKPDHEKMKNGTKK